MNKLCTVCKASDALCGRRYCHTCFLARVRMQQKERGRYHRLIKCPICNETFKSFRREQIICTICRRQILYTSHIKNKYVNAGGGGYCWEHRKIAEFLLNIKLRTDQVVHHVDGNPQNNDLNNLWILSNGAHTKLHMYLQNTKVAFAAQKDTAQIDDWNKLIHKLSEAWLISTSTDAIKLEVFKNSEKAELLQLEKLRICESQKEARVKTDKKCKGSRKIHLCVCGNTKTRRAQLCQSCYDARLKNEYIISRSDLITALKNKESFLSIGRRYAVTDNTIRKYCKRFDLPRLTRIIRAMTEEDWLEYEQ